MWRRLLLGAAVVAAVLFSVKSRSAHAAGSPLVGVWRVDAGPSAAGLYIYTPTHYSMMAASTARPEITDATATADELRADWGPMLANSGSYDISGDLITIHPIAAKFPVVMKPGAYEVYRFKIEGDTLMLTQVRNVRGPVEKGGTTRLLRVE
jgi:hypothetical protein